MEDAILALTSYDLQNQVCKIQKFSSVNTKLGFIIRAKTGSNKHHLIKTLNQLPNEVSNVNHGGVIPKVNQASIR